MHYTPVTLKQIGVPTFFLVAVYGGGMLLVAGLHRTPPDVATLAQVTLLARAVDVRQPWNA